MIPPFTIRNILIAGIVILLLAMLVNVVLNPGGPRVTVNMPADAKPLSTLTEPGDKVIGGDRAVLWYTVFRALADKGYVESAVNAADRAVDKVYGQTPPKTP